MTKKEERALTLRLNKTRDLLKEFGVIPYAYDPGVRCYVGNVEGDQFAPVVDFDEETWAWLEPLLQELRMYRKASASILADGSERVVNSTDRESTRSAVLKPMRRRK